jgi:hypothetical protein
MSAPELAWERALELAPAGEVEELERLEALSRTQESETLPMLETLQRMRELKERMFYRSSPTWAGFYRRQRCLLWWGLKQLEEEAIEADDGSNPRRYGLGTAQVNWMHAVELGAEPITDPEEASRMLAEVVGAVDAGDTDRVLRLVGRTRRRHA